MNSRLIVIIAVALAGNSFATAQGTVSFNNNIAFLTPGDRLVYGLDGSPLAGTNWVTQLYYGSSSSSLAPAWDALGADIAAPARFRPLTTTTPGTWSGGPRSLPGVGLGEFTTLQVRVWDSNEYASYEAAAGSPGAVLGSSAPFSYQAPPSGSPPAAFFMENFAAFALIPEPSTVATLCLGLALVLVTGRRRR